MIFQGDAENPTLDVLALRPDLDIQVGVDNGDTIAIDIPARTLSLEVPEEEMARRRAKSIQRKRTSLASFVEDNESEEVLHGRE